jgi:flagellar biosynthesis/type III secretory pathway chaperone
VTDEKQLLDIFDELLQAHEALLSLVHEKKDILIQGQLDKLSALTVQEWRWIQRIESLEKERISHVSVFAREKGLAEESLTARQLPSLLGDPFLSARMKGLIERLTSVLDELKKANELNAQLLRQSLTFVQMTLDLLTDTSNSIQYHERGTTSSAPRRSFFDAKV